MDEQQVELNSVKRAITNTPQNLNQIWQSYPVLWQQLSWNQSQLRLWLRALPDIQITNSTSEDPQYHIQQDNSGNDLGDTIASIVTALGKPMPIALLKKKMPPGTMVTDPMIQAAVKSHPKLQLKGPLISAIQ